jgi:hypothetical protein
VSKRNCRSAWYTAVNVLKSKLSSDNRTAKNLPIYCVAKLAKPEEDWVEEEQNLFDLQLILVDIVTALEWKQLKAEEIHLTSHIKCACCWEEMDLEISGNWEVKAVDQDKDL